MPEPTCPHCTWAVCPSSAHTDTVHIGDDPAGQRVEIATARHAFGPSADDVVVEGLVIEKYAIMGHRTGPIEYCQYSTPHHPDRSLLSGSVSYGRS
jgi:hypothetical protein